MRTERVTTKQPTTYYNVKNCKTRIQVHQGGTRSGKTYSIIQTLVELCYLNQEAGMTISIVRKTFPTIKRTVLKDFIEILESQGWYDENNHNKSDQTYSLFGNTIEFFSVDDGQKVRGAKRHLLYCNEANELSLEDFRQLNMRTTMRVILDYNPSDPYHWIYDEVLSRDDCSFYQTTYLDNPYLSDEIIKEIELFRDSDPDYWAVYGLGQRASNRRAVYQADKATTVPKNAKLVGYGLDWGFSADPTAIVALYERGQEMYVQQLVYETGLTNTDIHDRLNDLGITRQDYIICDSAEPKSIEELKRRGWNVHPAKKGPDSIRKGIDQMKQFKLFYVGEDLQREFIQYKWKVDRDGRILNQPEDKHNHALDAARYVVLNLKSQKKRGEYHIW